jgi:hypothetical protein
MFIPGTQILCIEDFIDAEMHNSLVKMLYDDYEKNLKPQEGDIALLNKSFVYDDNYLPIVDFIFDKSNEILKEYFDTPSTFKAKDRINHFRSGHGLKVHTDNVHLSSVSHGAVYYITDDYEGGEIYYPTLGLEFKPKANSLIIHPAQNGYEHGVRDVIAGDRFTITYFAFP